jgi:hypothetical protein
MPIRFRCPYCNRLLGIARRKAGAETVCPQCGKTVTVPGPDDTPPAESPALDLDDAPSVPRMSGPAVSAAPPAAAAAPPAAAPRPAAKPQPRRQPEDDLPLFEGEDFDALLGVKPKPDPLDLDDRPAKQPVTGMDALSLEEEPRPLVLTPQRATLLVALVVVLLGVAFAAGFLIGSNM